MAASSRRKGVLGEREVARIWQAAGFEVRGLEGLGDHLVVRHTANAEPVSSRNRALLHIECKRQERVRLPEWLAQAKAEAPQGTIPVVAFRQNKGEWYAALPLESLAELAS
jgi:Holliday junction resolvase